MFRVQESEGDGGHGVAEWVVQFALLLTLLANFGCVFFLWKEHQHLGTLVDRPEPMAVVSLASLRDEVGLQLAASLAMSVLLTVCVATIWRLRRRHQSSQKSLRQVKMLAHDILASMDRGVVTTDQKGIITSINSAAMSLLMVGVECVGRPLAALDPAGVPLTDVYQEVAARQATVRDRDAQVPRDGRLLCLRVDGHVLKDTRGHSLGSVIHLRDVTERRLLEERMQRMERFLNLASLASGLHHEIKNPLTALSIHIQLLEEELANGMSSAAVDELVGVLKTEVCRLNGVLESFRGFANLQRLTIQPTDPLGVVENAIRLIRPQATEQQVRIMLLHPPKEFGTVPLDTEKFEQVILNLLINALEAMPGGGVLTVGAAVAEGEFRLSVQDSGPGIAPEIRPNLFQPYFSTKERGSGMGLALSEKLISQHGGQIGYRTGPGGTTFEISIPLERRNGST